MHQSVVARSKSSSKSSNSNDFCTDLDLHALLEPARGVALFCQPVAAVRDPLKVSERRVALHLSRLASHDAHEVVQQLLVELPPPVFLERRLLSRRPAARRTVDRHALVEFGPGERSSPPVQLSAVVMQHRAKHGLLNVSGAELQSRAAGEAATTVVILIVGRRTVKQDIYHLTTGPSRRYEFSALNVKIK